MVAAAIHTSSQRKTRFKFSEYGDRHDNDRSAGYESEHLGMSGAQMRVSTCVKNQPLRRPHPQYRRSTTRCERNAAVNSSRSAGVHVTYRRRRVRRTSRPTASRRRVKTVLFKLSPRSSLIARSWRESSVSTLRSVICVTIMPSPAYSLTACRQERSRGSYRAVRVMSSRKASC